MSEMDKQRKQVQEKQISNEAEIEENKNILNQEKDSHYQKSLSPNDVEEVDAVEEAVVEEVVPGVGFFLSLYIECNAFCIVFVRKD